MKYTASSNKQGCVNITWRGDDFEEATKIFGVKKEKR
jgi:hypothetical protein